MLRRGKCLALEAIMQGNTVEHTMYASVYI